MSGTKLSECDFATGSKELVEWPPGERVVNLDGRDVPRHQPRRRLRHHVGLVIVSGTGEFGDLLDERLGPCRVSVDVPIAGLPFCSGHWQCPGPETADRQLTLSALSPWELVGYSLVADRLPDTDARSISSRSAKTHLVVNAAELSNKPARLDLAPCLPYTMRHSSTQRRR
jgi:hypothetical protein